MLIISPEVIFYTPGLLIFFCYEYVNLNSHSNNMLVGLFKNRLYSQKSSINEKYVDIQLIVLSQLRLNVY